MSSRGNNKIPFGLKDGTLVQVSEVESGLACGCVCPACGRRLQANKGKKVSHYFSHDPSEEMRSCKSAFETSVHLMAKQILSEEGMAIFPALNIKVSGSDMNGTVHTAEKTVEEESVRHFNRVALEMRLEQIRPDIIAYRDDVPYLIEVAVTHFVDNAKKAWIRNLGLPAIEVDLSSVSYETTKDELLTLLVESAKYKTWISNPKAVGVKKELKAILDDKIRRINEDVYRRRNQRAAKRVTAAAPRKRPTPSKVAAQKRGTTYDQRWFVCEACRCVFSLPIIDAPYALSSIACPQCDHAVSTKRFGA